MVSPRPPTPLVLLLLSASLVAHARLVTLRNDVPRLDVDGNVIDCHSGMIVAKDNTFYLYGERYNDTVGIGPSPPLLFPKIVVYTSPDLANWTYQGYALDDWPTKPYGTFFTPWVVFNKATSQFVLWFNAYLNGCCNGNWGVATSRDGIHFTVVSMNVSGTYGGVDCNGLFVDDDGTAYNVYSSLAEGHKVSIETLDGNYTGVVPGGNLGLFPDGFVEGSVMWKRGSTYYVAYGECCCFCRAGSGVVVYSSTSVRGPWTRQPLDVNCELDKAGDVCGQGDPLIINAQGIGLSVIPLADGTVAYLWHGERWLSAPNNNPTCTNECQPCEEPADYVKGHGFMYWVPLNFSSNGTVQTFAPFVDAFTLDVAEEFGTAHLPGSPPATAVPAPLTPPPPPSVFELA